MRLPSYRRIGVWITAVGIIAAAGSVAVGIDPFESEELVFDPHGDGDSGVLRIITDPPSRGECTQCHDLHTMAGGGGEHPHGLFAPNDNFLCYTPDGASPCHQSTPPGYPADESDRIPEGLPGAGYFEVNAGGARLPGVAMRERWPGSIVYEDERIIGYNRHVSPHRSDPDMPLKDNAGYGLCLNCHNPHGTNHEFDILKGRNGPISGWQDQGAPEAYGLCFGCHGSAGPSGMAQENRWIEDYYNEWLQGDGTAGHRIRFSEKSAISWPTTVRRGDRLPCYDCHNPHGSRGYDSSRPNAFLISDQREEWSGLTDTVTDPEQSRRFCFGCHIPSDGIPGSKSVEGIFMNAIPSSVPEHGSMSFAGCFECHGGEYGSPRDHNVHHPLLP